MLVASERGEPGVLEQPQSTGGETRGDDKR